MADGPVDAAADTAKEVARGVTPAHSGWILGFIIVVLIIVGSDAWVSLKTLKSNEATGVETAKFFAQVEANRAEQFKVAMASWGEQARRYQETIRELTESVARDSERAGQAAVSALDTATRRAYLDGVTIQSTPSDPNFIGPPLPPAGD